MTQEHELATGLHLINRSVAAVVATILKLANDGNNFIQEGDMTLHWHDGEWWVVRFDKPIGEAEYHGKYLQPALDILYGKKAKKAKA